MFRTFPSKRLTMVCLLLLTFCLSSVSGTWANSFQDEKNAKARKEDNKSVRAAEYVNQEAGIKFVKPKPDWEVVTSPSIFQQIVCIPSAGEQVDRFSQRFVVMIFPANAISGGMEYRRQQILNVTADPYKKNPYSVQQVRFGPAKLGGKDCEVYEYDFIQPLPDVSLRTVEYGIYAQGNFYILQATAPITDWENPEIAGMFERTFNSIGFVKIPTSRN